MNGFGNEFESEASGYESALPTNQINPQVNKFNLFAEQLSGSAFTAPRGQNKRSWFYRLRPSVCHTPFKLVKDDYYGFKSGRKDPNQRRWLPFTMESEEPYKHFVHRLRLLAFSDDSGCASSSVAIYIYSFQGCFKPYPATFVNADGDFLFVPQSGTLEIRTEFGNLKVKPNELAVIQQGMKFAIDEDRVFYRGYVLEIKGNHFELPYLGPIGANGLANPRDFQVPQASIETCRHSIPGQDIYLKSQNELYLAHQDHSPFDVAAWFGNYVPYKYDLSKFVSVNSVSVDHPDPSIFTVLTCPSIGKPGTALADFVIFPPRWECASNTFRPPYFHRNCMTEFMGLISGQYQAKSGKFAPGGASLHQAMMPHGPDEECFVAASTQDTSVPKRV